LYNIVSIETAQYNYKEVNLREFGLPRLNAVVTIDINSAILKSRPEIKRRQKTEMPALHNNQT
jgi:hypothetical protein